MPSRDFFQRQELKASICFCPYRAIEDSVVCACGCAVWCTCACFLVRLPLLCHSSPSSLHVDCATAGWLLDGTRPLPCDSLNSLEAANRQQKCAWLTVSLLPPAALRAFFCLMSWSFNCSFGGCAFRMQHTKYFGVSCFPILPIPIVCMKQKRSERSKRVLNTETLHCNHTNKDERNCSKHTNPPTEPADKAMHNYSSELSEKIT